MPDHASPNRWAILGLLGVAQLMVILDSTIVNIALPSAQEDLGFSTESRQWVVTAYALAFGSLLLVGGKLGDLFGRKWTFIGGLIGFSAASFLGGLAPSFEVLVAARSKAAESPLTRLTPREREILSEMAQGKNNAAIAEALVLTPRAVEKHINSIFSKLGLSEEKEVHRRVKAVLLFLTDDGGG